MSNGTENFRNFQISWKKDNLKKLTEIFEMIFRKFSVPFDFEPEFSDVSVEWNAPLNFRKLFPEVLPFYSIISDRKSRNFWSNGKRP